jgi:hypothetical protein
MLKDLMGGTIQRMLNSELDDELGMISMIPRTKKLRIPETVSVRRQSVQSMEK